jgi:hypothetical protein
MFFSQENLPFFTSTIRIGKKIDNDAVVLRFDAINGVGELSTHSGTVLVHCSYVE